LELKNISANATVSLKYCQNCTFQIEVGSTNVRVGSTIFGAREYKGVVMPSAGGEQTLTSLSTPEESTNCEKQLEQLNIKDKS